MTEQLQRAEQAQKDAKAALEDIMAKEKATGEEMLAACAEMQKTTAFLSRRALALAVTFYVRRYRKQLNFGC